MYKDLGDTLEDGWGARIRTWAWRNQNPLPYRLATPQQSLEMTAVIRVFRMGFKGEQELSRSAVQSSTSCAKPAARRLLPTLP